MAGRSPWAYFSEPAGDANFNGGLNTAGGNLSLQDNESSSLQNVDFNFLGSVLQRNGYTVLGTTQAIFQDKNITFGSSIATFGSPNSSYSSTINAQSDGLWWYESTQSGSLTYLFIAVSNGNIYYMLGFSGNWINITGSNTITPGNMCCFENFFNILYITNGQDAPFQVTGTGNSTIIPALQNNSYTFQVANVVVTPTNGSTYTNNGITFTVVGNNLFVGAEGLAGTITVTGSNVPSTSGTLTKASGTGDTFISFTVYGANTNITTAKYVEQFNNYLFLANCTAAGVYYPTRIYWSNLQDTTTWLQSSFLEISENDGQQITGMKVLGQNLIIFKTRSIYIVSFTGDADAPFILQGGGKANSDVGCVSHFSIQEVQNGLVFLSPDGLYYFDGINSNKISDRINPTILGLNQLQLSNARSCVQRIKHRYMFAVQSNNNPNNDTIITWDWYLNAFSVHTGMSPSTMCTTYTNGFTENIWFGDYNGYYYHMDTTSLNDFPLNVATPINSWYYTNWKDFGDLIDQMTIPQTVLYYQISNSNLTFSYSYDLNTSDQYSLPVPLSGTGSLFGTGVFGIATFGQSGGNLARIDLNGRGRVVRFKFASNSLNNTWRVDALGQFPNVETEE